VGSYSVSNGDHAPVPLLEQSFTLSDPLIEEMLIDSPGFRRFAGTDMIEDRILDETTIFNFRQLLEEHRIAEQDPSGSEPDAERERVML